MTFDKANRGSRNAGEPTISLRKSNSIGVNAAALEEFFEGAEYCEVLYEVDENLLAFKPLDEKTDDAYTISRTNGSGSITPTAFLKKHELIPSQTAHYNPRRVEYEDDDLVAIDVDNPDGHYGDPDD